MVGQTLGHYRILEKIGAGGMGEVYRARDENLNREVAVKVLPAGLLADEGARRSLRKEAEVLAQLNHPNIAVIHDFATQDGADFLVMEYVPGESLAEKLAAGPLLERQVAELGEQIASALEAAHEHGVIHRDLKPGNVIVTPKGRAKVLDFGLAKLLRPVVDAAATETLTETRAMAGTLPYMAPEQLRGEPVDRRTDIHALGAILYEMATRRRPFEAKLATALAADIQTKPPEPPRLRNARLSAEVERIILKCLEKDPESRYQSAKEVAVDLRRLRMPTAVGVAVAPGRRAPRKAWWMAAVAIAAVLTVLAGLNVGGWRERLLGKTGPPRIQSLAVLPLENLSGAPDQEYFADGMTDTLIAELSKISALKVISRTSVMHYKGGARKPLPQIARELGVDAVVEGTVTREGERVRISVSSFTGRPTSICGPKATNGNCEGFWCCRVRWPGRSPAKSRRK